MTRVISTTVSGLLAAGLLIAGCGGGDGGSSDDPLSAALGYLPAETPFVATFDTDLESEQLSAVEDAIPPGLGVDDLRGMLNSLFEENGAGVSFSEDVEPVLGNPVVLSATDVPSFLDNTGDDDFVAAIKAADGEALDRLIEAAGVEEAEEIAGASVYAGGFAVEDDIVVFAGSEELLTEALERADGDDGLDSDTFSAGFDGLPDGALIDLYFNVGELIDNDPDTEQARAVPWVAALTTLGMTLSVADDEISLEFNLRSDGEELAEEELPLAPGPEAPAVISDPQRIGIGVRDPSHIIRFFEDTLALLEPEQFEEYEAAKPVIADQFGIDLDQDVIEQLTGDVAVSLGLDGSFGAQAKLADPESFAATLAKLARSLPAVGEDFGVTGIRRQGPLYTAQLADGGEIVFGMTDATFAVGSDVDSLRASAGDQGPRPVDGASGSFVLGADAGGLVSQTLALLGAQLGGAADVPQGLLDQLGELVGSLETSTDGMTGRLSLALGG